MRKRLKFLPSIHPSPSALHTSSSLCLSSITTIILKFASSQSKYNSHISSHPSSHPILAPSCRGFSPWSSALDKIASASSSCDPPTLIHLACLVLARVEHECNICVILWDLFHHPLRRAACRIICATTPKQLFLQSRHGAASAPGCRLICLEFPLN